jgi:hypothetical protein
MWKVKQAQLFLLCCAFWVIVVAICIFNPSGGDCNNIYSVAISFFGIVYPISALIYITAPKKNYWVSSGMFILLIAWLLLFYIVYQISHKPFARIQF